MKTYEIRFIGNESEVYRKFVLKLSREAQAKLARIYWFLKQHGTDVGMPYSRRLSQNLWEMRVITRQQIRVLYTFKGEKIYFLNWFFKKTNQIPKRELDKAKKKLTQI